MEPQPTVTQNHRGPIRPWCTATLDLYLYRSYPCLQSNFTSVRAEVLTISWPPTVPRTLQSQGYQQRGRLLYFVEGYQQIYPHLTTHLFWSIGFVSIAVLLRLLCKFETFLSCRDMMKPVYRPNAFHDCRNSYLTIFWIERQEKLSYCHTAPSLAQHKIKCINWYISYKYYKN